MKNYTYGWKLKEMGYVEIPAEKYDTNQKEMSDYIAMLSNVVATAKCGWDGVWYKLMVDQSGYPSPYMVLHVDGCGERWIPIDGNSKGCNLEIVGKNLW